jgi:hypothetical protein
MRSSDKQPNKLGVSAHDEGNKYSVKLQRS